MNLPENGVFSAQISQQDKEYLASIGWRCVGYVKPEGFPGYVLYTNLEGLSCAELYNLTFGTNAATILPPSGVAAAPLGSELKSEIKTAGWIRVGQVRPPNMPSKVLYTRLVGLSDIELYNIACGTNVPEPTSQIPESGVAAAPLSIRLKATLLNAGWICIGQVKPYKMPGKTLYVRPDLAHENKNALYSLTS